MMLSSPPKRSIITEITDIPSKFQISLYLFDKSKYLSLRKNIFLLDQFILGLFIYLCFTHLDFNLQDKGNLRSAEYMYIK